MSTIATQRQNHRPALAGQVDFWLCYASTFKVFMKRPQIVNLELEDLPSTHKRTREYIEKLEQSLLRHIEVYQVDDQAWDKHQSAIEIFERLMKE